MSETLAKKRLAVLGAGKMGGILLQAFLKSGVVAAENLCATVAHPERAKAMARQFNIPVTCNDAAAAKTPTLSCCA